MVIHNSKKKGAIFMTDLDELEVIHHDVTRMFTILGQDRLDHCYLDETDVFTLRHARAHGIDLVEGLFSAILRSPGSAGDEPTCQPLDEPTTSDRRPVVPGSIQIDGYPTIQEWLVRSGKGGRPIR